MSKHTQEPWAERPAMKATAGGIIDVVDVFGANGDRVLCNITPEDRSRIVACVNGCAGINPEAVPHLLEACKILLVQLGEYKDGDGAAKYHAVNIGRAAIALATT